MGNAPDAVIEAGGAIIIGAGIAGLFTALKLAPFPATILCPSSLGASGSSIWAQGGIAAALGKDDSWELHAADTIAAGMELGDPEVAAFVTREARDRIEDLVGYGAPFDREPNGELALAREAAHSRARIVHVCGDRAGVQVMQALTKAVLDTPSISVMEGFCATELALDDGRVVGVFATRKEDATAPPVLIKGNAIVLASGGVGALYAVTTNPPDSRGEGLGMAARAGALIADAEFVQFHPTAIDFGRDPSPLATEALRGEGGILIDEHGRRFMPEIHPAAELAPRDVVARAIFRERERGHRVFLDCRTALGERFAAEFPTVYAASIASGLNPASQPIPVAPAAHYHMGGVATDHHGRSSLPGLWCVGECAGTGLHGANRLASNSLLEALVFGARVAEGVAGAEQQDDSRLCAPPHPSGPSGPLPESIRTAMMYWVGIERDADGLKRALAALRTAEKSSESPLGIRNALAAAKLIAAAAFARRESIGAQYRRDFPALPAKRQRSFLTLADAERIANEVDG
ncbi:MAG TPA: L-aspartate oxidase [Rhizomicrobium sp.]|jgi:L-aspartate oxidase